MTVIVLSVELKTNKKNETYIFVKWNCTWYSFRCTSCVHQKSFNNNLMTKKSNLQLNNINCYVARALRYYFSFFFSLFFLVYWIDGKRLFYVYMILVRTFWYFSFFYFCSRCQCRCHRCRCVDCVVCSSI